MLTILPDLTAGAVPALGIAAAPLLALSVLLLRHYPLKKAFRKLEDFLEGEAGGRLFAGQACFEGRYRDRRLLIKFKPLRRGARDTLMIFLESGPLSLDLEITGNDPLLCLADELTAVRITTGDPAFDARYRCVSALAGSAAHLSLPAIRRAVEAMFASGVSRLGLLPNDSSGAVAAFLEGPCPAALSEKRLVTLLALLEAFLPAPALGRNRPSPERGLTGFVIPSGFGRVRPIYYCGRGPYADTSS